MKFHSLLLPLLAGAVLSTVVKAAETLNVKFDRPQTIAVAGKTVELNGEFTPDGFWRYGEKGISIPADKLVGPAGTIIFTGKFDEFKPPFGPARYLLTLRTNSRLKIGFYTFDNRPMLHGSISNVANTFTYTGKEKVAPGTSYSMAVTWDGAIVRFFRDGLMVAEGKQEVPVEKVTMLNLGPYRDNWIATKPWGNDSLAGSLRVFNTALSPAEIAKLCGVKLSGADQTFPPALNIPRTAAEPKIDGVLDEEMWSCAGSLPGLIHGKKPAESFTFPPADFKLSYDDRNLYLGFTTLFPGHQPILAGAARTSDKEPEVWGSESFELYLEIDGKLYRFAGNVAGGSSEFCNSNTGWDGEWRYQSTLKMRIDDRQLWQGEAAIPWRTLGLNAPPSNPVKFNFCRTWCLPETATHSSLTASGSYGKLETAPELRTVPETAVMNVLENGNPCHGKFTQKVRFASPRDTRVGYRIEAASADGTAAPLLLTEKELSLKKNTPVTEDFVVSITSPRYDRLIFTLMDNGKLAARQVLPFQLQENYLIITPHFIQEKLQTEINLDMLKDQFGAGFQPRLRLLAPDGKIVREQAVSASIPFERRLTSGNYQLALVNATDNTVADTVEFFYPGIGEWENHRFDLTKVLPPFTPIEAVNRDNGLSASVYGRTYSWKKSLLVSQIESQGEALLKMPIAFSVDGKTIDCSHFTHTMTEPYRSAFTAKAANPNLDITENSWIEYDGLQYNQLDLTAKTDLKNVNIVITLPATAAKYLHVSGIRTWGEKITAAITEGERQIAFSHTLWLGNEEKGLCFFTESRADWNSDPKSTYLVNKTGDTVTLTVRLAQSVSKGQSIRYEFGFLATPVRPLARNYPLDTFSWGYIAPLNRPGKAPFSDVMIMHIGTGFYGFDDPFGDLYDQVDGEITRQLKAIHEFGGRAVPYNFARFMSDDYPEVAAFKEDWKIVPETAVDYQHDGKKHFIYDLCPTTPAADFYMEELRRQLKRHQVDGCYFDFSHMPQCNNAAHGCRERKPLLAMRDFYRKIVLTELENGIKDPILVMHNTDYVEMPIYTFATHFFNGEQVRQSSSSMLHDNKDILDTYGIDMFASELSSLPFGVNNAVYIPADKLAARYGGDGGDFELYNFRMTQAAMAGTLPHNTLPALNRTHAGLADKINRIFTAFGVPQAQFIGYWKHPAKVLQGEDIYVSVYRSAKANKMLAVISHIGKVHRDQEIAVTFDWPMLKLPVLTKAAELLTAPDPDYDQLVKAAKEYKVPENRGPLKLGDFGCEITGFQDGILKLKLKNHCFALVELSE